MLIRILIAHKFLTLDYTLKNFFIINFEYKMRIIYSIHL